MGSLTSVLKSESFDVKSRKKIFYRNWCFMGTRASVHHHLGHRWLRSSLCPTQRTAQKCDSSHFGFNSSLLLAFLVMLLHVTNEPLDRSHPESKDIVRHETILGWLGDSGRQW